MALFKISRGLKSNLPETITDGWCYFTTDDKKFWIDYGNERVPINAKNADTLAGAELATIISNDDTKIPTCGAVYANTQELTEAIIELESKTGFQADWNQNDETAIDYIKNRTHYIKKAGEEVLPETELIGMAIMSDIDELIVYDLLENNILLTIGNTYIITWLGSEFELVAVDSGFGPALGNLAIDKLGDDTGEPFLIITYTDYLLTRAYTLGTAVQGNVSIKCKNEEVYKLDKKYLPKLVGENIEGQIVTYFDPTSDWEEITGPAKTSAEIFNSYIDNEDLEIYRNIAVGEYSHAEGVSTIASGNYSHAEGGYTMASGNYSHAEGAKTIAVGDYQHVQGKYNIEDTENKYAHIVGNGEYSNDGSLNSNAHTLDWEGNAWFQGDIYLGGTGQEDYATKVVTEKTISQPKDYISLKDIENNFIYILQMKNGNLVSRRTISGIEITKMPNKLNYTEGEIFNPEGMEVVGYCEDGNIIIINNYTYPKTPISSNIITISYEEAGKTYIENINISISPFNPEEVLIDFYYTANEDGTYTITDWKGTYNGVSSTKIIVPDNTLIKI